MLLDDFNKSFDEMISDKFNNMRLALNLNPWVNLRAEGLCLSMDHFYKTFLSVQ